MNAREIAERWLHGAGIGFDERSDSDELDVLARAYLAQEARVRELEADIQRRQDILDRTAAHAVENSNGWLAAAKIANDREAALRALLDCVQVNGGRSGGGHVNPMFFSVKDTDAYAKAATHARATLESALLAEARKETT